MFKKLTACILTLALVMPSLLTFAQEPTARNLTVMRVEGEDAFLARSLGGRGAVPREGSRLNLGNVMTTGMDTQVYMQLDAASIVKMDEVSEVAVAAAGNLLSLSILRGSALVEVDWQEPGHTLETRLGSTVMSVRGTLFVAAIREGGVPVITMLSGEGAVLVADETGAIAEVPLTAGYVFWAHEADVDEAFNIRPLDLQAMSLFELTETWAYREYLLEIGTITPAMEAQLPQLIGVRQNERDTRRGVQAEALAVVLDNHVPAVQAELPETLLQAATPAAAPTEARVGEIIRFGGYYWRVLNVEGNQALVISEYVLFYRQYHHIWEPVTWETSDIRYYLNNDFFNRFSPEDRARIATATVINNDNQWFGTPGGNDTSDRIFLLSIEEVVRYFGDSGQLGNRLDNMNWIRDEYNEARIAKDLGGSASWWWLRSPGIHPGGAAAVYFNGYLRLDGRVVFVEGVGGGVRPALLLNLES